MIKTLIVSMLLTASSNVFALDCTEAQATALALKAMDKVVGVIPATEHVSVIPGLPGIINVFVNWHRSSADHAGYHDHAGIYHMFTLFKFDEKTCQQIEIGGTECEFI